MANAGYSKDYLLCRRMGVSRKYIKHLDEDDKLMTILKNHANVYIYLWMKWVDAYHSKDYSGCNNIHSEMDNIIITMNQLRQRNWYWKEITC